MILKLTDNFNTDEYFQMGMDWILKHQKHKKKLEARGSSPKKRGVTYQSELKLAPKEEMSVVDEAVARVAQATANIKGARSAGVPWENIMSDTEQAVRP